jgi:transposase
MGGAYFLFCAAAQKRKGFDGLFGLVRDRLGHDPLSGHLFLFSNRDRTRLKILVWDGSGLWVCANQPASHYTSFKSSPAF